MGTSNSGNLVISIRQGRWDDPEHNTLYMLGMPADLELVELRQSGADYSPKFKKFTLENLGVIPPVVRPLSDKQTDLAAWQTTVVDPASFPLIHPATGHPQPGATGTVTPESGKIFSIDIWRRRVFMQGTYAFIEQIWNPLGGWFRTIRNISDPHLYPSVIKNIRGLADGLDLLVLADSSGDRPIRGGSEARAVLSQHQKKLFRHTYNACMKSISATLEDYKWRQLKRYGNETRREIIRKAIADTPNEIVDSLLKYETAAQIAQQYAGWKSAGIAIGTWGPDRYFDLLKESQRV